MSNLKGLWSGKKKPAKSGKYKLKRGFWGGKFKNELKTKATTGKTFKGLKGGLFGTKKKTPKGPQKKSTTSSSSTITIKTGPADFYAPTEEEMAKWLDGEDKSISDAQEAANKKMTKLHDEEIKKLQAEDKKKADHEKILDFQKDKAIDDANKIWFLCMPNY